MKPPSAQSQAFDATRSAWLGRWVDTIPLGLHRLLSGFGLLELLLIGGHYSMALIMRINPPGRHVAGVYAVTTDAFVCRAV
jgi:hypothetical protein